LARELTVHGVSGTGHIDQNGVQMAAADENYHWIAYEFGMVIVNYPIL
jgi:hypothetical protein